MLAASETQELRRTRLLLLLEILGVLLVPLFLKYCWKYPLNEVGVTFSYIHGRYKAQAQVQSLFSKIFGVKNIQRDIKQKPQGFHHQGFFIFPRPLQSFHDICSATRTRHRCTMTQTISNTHRYPNRCIQTPLSGREG